jgi:hypothetical protein
LLAVNFHQPPPNQLKVISSPRAAHCPSVGQIERLLSAILRRSSPGSITSCPIHMRLVPQQKRLRRLLKIARKMVAGVH